MNKRILSSVYSLLCAYYFVQTSLCDGDDETKCLENCLTTLQQQAPDLDASRVLSIGHIRSGNESVVCPKYDSTKMNRTCDPFREAQRCFDTCPESELKTLSTSGFGPLQLLCVDRTADVERYMPCLSEACPSSESSCAQQCGSFDDLSRDLIRLVAAQSQSDSESPDDENPGNVGAAVHVDPNNVTQTISKACGSIQCYADCSRNAITSQCGQGAADLELDTIWAIFVSMTRRVSNFGVTETWPDTCKPLAARQQGGIGTAAGPPSQQPPPPQAGATPPVPIVQEESTTTTATERSNNVDQFLEAKEPTTTKAPSKASGTSVSMLTMLLSFLTAAFVVMKNSPY